MQITETKADPNKRSVIFEEHGMTVQVLQDGEDYKYIIICPILEYASEVYHLIEMLHEAAAVRAYP